MAKCLDEGVDPAQMCQSLVDRISRSRALNSIAEPELLSLFEDWLEELEKEFLRQVELSGSSDPALMARDLGVSIAGAQFLKAKLEQEGKI